MGKVEIIRCDENNDVYLKKAVLNFFYEICLRLEDKNLVYVAVSGGSSVKGFYDMVVKKSQLISEKIWKKIRFCFADERLVPLDDINSNYGDLYSNFFKKLIDLGLIVDEQIITIDMNSSDVVKDYNQKIKKVDIALLGVGPDCHTCSLFPEHSSIYDERKGYILVENSPKPPSRRISMSKRMFDDVESVFIFFTSPEKKEALKMFEDMDVNEVKCPAKVALRSKRTYVVICV